MRTTSSMSSPIVLVRRPTHTPEQEGTHILDYLQQGQYLLRQIDFLEKPVAYLAAIGNAYAAARSHHTGVLKKWLHHPLQAVTLQDGICVHPAEKWVACRVDARVEGIGLTTAFLVDHP